jgi:DNA polymerase II large subunit
VHVPSVTESGEETLHRVEAVSKHPSPDHLVRVETKSGRELTVTPDHSMRRWTDDGIERVPARELTTEDALPAPKQIPVDGETATFDLLAEFLDADAVPNDDLMIRGLGESDLKRLLGDATAAESYLKPVAELLGVSQSTVYNWVSRDSIPAGVLLELYDRDAVVERVPTDVTLGIHRDGTSISRQFEVDAAVGTMLGYYAAEGFTRQEIGSFYQTTICTPDDAPRDELIDVFDDVFDVEAFEENEWKVTVSSRLVTTLFSDVLDAGSRAETKRIPDCVLSAPDSVLRTFLAAYFSGDGSTSSERVEVRAHTVSDDLQSDLVAALKRFGIATKVYREERTPKTGAVAEFYDGDPPAFDTWILKVTSENAVRFAERFERRDTFGDAASVLSTPGNAPPGGCSTTAPRSIAVLSGATWHTPSSRTDRRRVSAVLHATTPPGHAGPDIKALPYPRERLSRPGVCAVGDGRTSRPLFEHFDFVPVERFERLYEGERDVCPVCGVWPSDDRTCRCPGVVWAKDF